jgi:hypothetical protein
MKKIIGLACTLALFIACNNTPQENKEETAQPKSDDMQKFSTEQLEMIRSINIRLEMQKGLRSDHQLWRYNYKFNGG